MSVSLCQVARVVHFQQDFATKTFTKLILAQKAISRQNMVGIITTNTMATMGNNLGIIFCWFEDIL